MSKLQPSPSSASSYSNTSSLFRDDGFEDDFVSTASERTSTYQSSTSSYSSTIQNHRLSFQGRSHHSRRSFHHYQSRRATNDVDEYQSCEEDFSKSFLTKSLGYLDSNLSITQRVVTEIIETERTYVDDLEQIVTGYLCYLRNVLKQQKQFQIKGTKPSQPLANGPNKQSSLITGSSVATDSLRSIDDDDKSLLVFDDDATSVIHGDVDEDDVEDSDAIIKNSTLQPPINESRRHSVPQDRDSERQVFNDGAIITANHIKKLFSNLEDIHKFNKDFLFRLEECYLNPSSIAECFVENSAGFEVYTHYCTAYPQVVSTLTELMANPKSAQILRERQDELNQSLPLGAYLLKPVQRILKYHILFESLITHTANDEALDDKDRQLISEAFSAMANIASHINAMKRKHEHAIRVQEVQGLLTGWRGPDLTTLGELILEDSFKLYDRPKSSRHLFLFDTVLLITKKKRDGSLTHKGHIECSNLMLIENIKGQPLVFETVPFDNPKALCTFQARNMEKKRDWCLQMKEVMIKSYEVKIPMHVRDILMSLTKSDTPDDSDEVIEATKAIRAPNYLEKKKSKQEKK